MISASVAPRAPPIISRIFALLLSVGGAKALPSDCRPFCWPSPLPAGGIVGGSLLRRDVRLVPQQWRLCHSVPRSSCMLVSYSARASPHDDSSLCLRRKGKRKVAGPSEKCGRANVRRSSASGSAPQKLTPVPPIRERRVNWVAREIGARRRVLLHLDL